MSAELAVFLGEMCVGALRQDRNKLAAELGREGLEHPVRATLRASIQERARQLFSALG